MALKTDELKQAIYSACAENVPSDSEEDMMRFFADKLADAIYAYLLSAKVTVTVNTTGSANAQSGGGTGSLS